MTTDYKRKAKLLDAINILIIIAFALLVAVLVVNPMSNPYKLDARWEKIDSIISAYNVVQREVDSLYEVIENQQSLINDQDWQIQIQNYGNQRNITQDSAGSYRHGHARPMEQEGLCY